VLCSRQFDKRRKCNHVASQFGRQHYGSRERNYGVNGYDGRGRYARTHFCSTCYYAGNSTGTTMSAGNSSGANATGADASGANSTSASNATTLPTSVQPVDNTTASANVTTSSSTMLNATGECVLTLTFNVFGRHQFDHHVAGFCSARRQHYGICKRYNDNLVRDDRCACERVLPNVKFLQHRALSADHCWAMRRPLAQLLIRHRLTPTASLLSIDTVGMLSCCNHVPSPMASVIFVHL
jgi:hypothetical protein